MWPTPRMNHGLHAGAVRDGQRRRKPRKPRSRYKNDRRLDDGWKWDEQAEQWYREAKTF